MITWNIKAGTGDCQITNGPCIKVYYIACRNVDEILFIPGFQDAAFSAILLFPFWFNHMTKNSFSTGNCEWFYLFIFMTIFVQVFCTALFIFDVRVPRTRLYSSTSKRKGLF